MVIKPSANEVTPLPQGYIKTNTATPIAPSGLATLSKLRMKILKARLLEGIAGNSRERPITSPTNKIRGSLMGDQREVVHSPKGKS